MALRYSFSLEWNNWNCGSIDKSLLHMCAFVCIEDNKKKRDLIVSFYLTLWWWLNTDYTFTQCVRLVYVVRRLYSNYYTYITSITSMLGRWTKYYDYIEVPAVATHFFILWIRLYITRRLDVLNKFVFWSQFKFNCHALQ